MVIGLVVFSQLFWLRVLPGGAGLVQPRWMPERRILGGGRTRGISFWPFWNSSGWWWLISSVFLSRTSCRKTTHANGYYGAWPEWVFSVSVLSLTTNPKDCSPPSSSVWDSPGKNTGVSCLAFLQEIFLTQGLNPCLSCISCIAGGFFTHWATWEALALK